MKRDMREIAGTPKVWCSEARNERGERDSQVREMQCV